MAAPPRSADLIRFETAEAVFDAFPKLGEAIAARPGAEAPLAFMERLGAGPEPFDAIRFAAHMLPRREAVGWLCAALRATPEIDLAAGDAAIEAAEAWLREPGETRRVTALKLAERLDPRAPATWAAFAAAWSGGNLSVGDYPGAPAPADLAAQAVTGGLAIALGRVPVAKSRATIQAWLAACTRIARKGAP
ncbi:DUF6931 family protein [Rhabdaerophilum calidifontis]|uniref:DUF6931 family protein n=1 Tax=Rhabdaerophilum calidifontis TaxID=2604328 RepID=UPI0012383EDA|nr:hypothetical protein [Rhabdaerophilum calidifontis]